MHRGILLAVGLLIAGLATSSVGAGPPGPEGHGIAAEALAGPRVGPMDANISATIAADVSVADPGDSVRLNATVRSVGNETATNVTLVAPVDPNSTYLWSLPIATFDPINLTLRWTLASLPAGGRADLLWAVRVKVGTPDNTTIISRLRASYENATGVPLPPAESLTSFRVRSAVFDPQLQPVPARAGHGDSVVAKLYANNTGSATALRAWSNWTLGGHFRFQYLEGAVNVTNVTDGFRVALTNLAPGPHMLTAHLTVIDGLSDGLSMELQADWTATDGNGNRLPPSTSRAAIDLLAPTFVFTMNASSVRVDTTSRFVLTVTVRNTGRAPGLGWLNMTVPNGVSFISDNGSDPRTNTGKRYGWTILSLAPGGTDIFGMTFESSSNPQVASFVYTLEFTDGKGSPPAAVSGPRIDVEVVTAPPSPVPTDWPFLVAAFAPAGGLVAFLVWRRRRASTLQIEDVFVADMAGHLLAHRSSGLVAYEDEDILVGMFKVMQDFVKDSFAKGTDDMMKSLEFGERTIIIERGLHHFISVVYRGQDRGSLAERVKKVSRLIDQRFGKTLENWSGDLDELRALASLLPQVWKHQPRSRAPLPHSPPAAGGAGGPSSDGQAAAKEGDPAEAPGTAVPVEPQK